MKLKTTGEVPSCVLTRALSVNDLAAGPYRTSKKVVEGAPYYIVKHAAYIKQRPPSLKTSIRCMLAMTITNDLLRFIPSGKVT